MPFGIASSLTTLFSGKWMIAIIGIIVASLVATIFYYRSQSIEYESQLIQAKREISNLKQQIKAMRFMDHLDNNLIDDLEQQTDQLDQQRDQERENTQRDIDAIRQRITEQVKEELERKRQRSSSQPTTESSSETSNQQTSNINCPFRRQQSSEPLNQHQSEDKKDYERLYKTLIRVNDAASDRVIDGMYNTYCRVTNTSDCPQ